MPFSRPGAIDLSALKRPATPAAGAPGAGAPTAGTPGAGASYSVEVDETNFEQLLHASMTAPVVLVVYSPSRMPSEAPDLVSKKCACDGSIRAQTRSPGRAT